MKTLLEDVMAKSFLIMEKDIESHMQNCYNSQEIVRPAEQKMTLKKNNKNYIRHRYRISIYNEIEKSSII